MKTLFRSLAIALLSALSSQIAIAQSSIRIAVTTPEGRLSVTQNGAHTVLTGKLRGQSIQITLPEEDGIYPRSLNAARFLGDIANRVIILSIDYGSRPGNPNAMCGAGTETVIRVITLKPHLHQSFHKLVESCWGNIESSSIDILTTADHIALTTDLLTPDGAVHSQYAVAADGAVTAISSTATQP